MKYGLYTPSDVLKASIDGSLDIDEYDNNLGKQLNKLGAKKGNLSKGQWKTKNKDKIDELTKDIKLIQKYRNRIKLYLKVKRPLEPVIHNQNGMLTKYHLVVNMVI